VWEMQEARLRTFLLGLSNLSTEFFVIHIWERLQEGATTLGMTTKYKDPSCCCFKIMDKGKCNRLLNAHLLGITQKGLLWALKEFPQGHPKIYLHCHSKKKMCLEFGPIVRLHALVIHSNQESVLGSTFYKIITTRPLFSVVSLYI